MRLQEFTTSKYKKVNVKSPAFKAWFGKSVVRNLDGSPRIMYHATDKNFNEFDIMRGELGQHFGSRQQANSRADWLDFHSHYYNKHFYKNVSITGISILPVYLRILNPIRLQDVDTFSVHKVAEQLYQKHIINDKLANILDRYANNSKIGAGLIRKILMSKGYDGVVYSNKYEGRGSSYIIFNPSQVKSAITNTGKFKLRARKITESRSTTVVYHGTSEDRVPAILANGLQVGSARGIYASPSKELALRWATQRAKERVDWEPEKLIDLKLALFTINARDFGEDHDKNIMMTTSDIPVQDILALDIYQIKDMPKFPLSNHIGDEWRNPRPIKTKQFVSEKIGPHSGKEASMLIAGTKPAGIITENKNIENTVPFIDAVEQQVQPLSSELKTKYKLQYGKHSIWNDSVIFSLTPVYGNNEHGERVPMGTYLSDVHSIKQGKGYGSAFLKWLNELADKFNVTITGYADPSKHGNLDFTGLRKWYSKHGFDFSDRGGAMQRMPKNV